MTIAAVAVLGAGQMGGGIAHICALAGIRVFLYDRQPDALPQAINTITANLARQVKKDAISAQQAEAAQANIQTRSALGDWLRDCDFIIEAVSEELAIKNALYRALAAHIATHTVLASNTSSYSITKLAAAAPDASRFIGMHFMNPPPLMPLVEIITGAHTDAAVYERTRELAERLGKQTIRAGDSPGFLTNRILLPMINEAAFALLENIGDVEDIDRAMTLGMRHPMGPLTLADFIGLDTCLAILNVLYDGFQDTKYRPCPLFKQLVTAGCLGRKSGIGFYDYRASPPRPAPLFCKD